LRQAVAKFLRRGKKLSEIHPLLIEKHKQIRLAAGVEVAVNRELTCLKQIFYKAIDWNKFDEPGAQDQEAG
jgi:hypothetical protein